MTNVSLVVNDSLDVNILEKGKDDRIGENMGLLENVIY